MLARVGSGWGRAHGYVVPEMPTEIVFIAVKVESSKIRGSSHTKIQPDQTPLNGAAKYWPWKPNGGKRSSIALSYVCLVHAANTQAGMGASC